MVCILISEPPKPASDVQALVKVNLILQLLNALFKKKKLQFLKET